MCKLYEIQTINSWMLLLDGLEQAMMVLFLIIVLKTLCRLKIKNVLIVLVIVAAMVLYNIAKIQNEAEPNIEEDINAEELIN
nr:unnamed protein product [Callosobruchus analis]